MCTLFDMSQSKPEFSVNFDSGVGGDAIASVGTGRLLSSIHQALMLTWIVTVEGDMFQVECCKCRID